MLALLCPGQGSQKPGFMNPWLELPEFKENIGSLGELIKVDLIKHGSVSDEETIRDTAIAQPLIVSATVATANLLDLNQVDAVAGHSVGEVPAGYIAGILSETQTMGLVQARAQAMAKAAKLIPDTGMAAVLGGEQAEVLSRLESLGLSAANFNGAGQIVAAGSTAAIAELVANPAAGSKVIPLAVAGAFHTKYMVEAGNELANYANSLQLTEPSKTIWSNQNAQKISSAEEYLKLLIGQVSNSVRWDLCMTAMEKAGVNQVIELSPAGTLAGLAKRGMSGVEIVALKSPADLDSAKEMLARK